MPVNDSRASCRQVLQPFGNHDSVHSMTKPSSKSRRPKPTRVTRDLVSDVRQRLLANKRVRRTLPNGGRLHIDRQLPFLCVYRAPQHQDVGTSRFVVGEASYLVTQSDSISRTGVGTLLRERV